MIRTKEIKKLWEADPKTFGTNLRKVYGIQESDTRPSIDAQAAQDLNNLSPVKMARDFFGSDYSDYVRNYLEGNSHPFHRSRFQEMDGAPVTGSLMSPINLWTQGVLGIYDAKVLDGYNLPEFAFRELTTEVPTLVPGGHKHIRASYDGSLPTEALQENQPAPAVGQTPAWIWTQSIETHQVQMSLTMESVLSDITGQLQEKAITVGRATAFNENNRGFDVITGRVNTYCYNGVTNIPNCDTYLASSAGNGLLATGKSAPFNFINALTGSSNVLVDHLSLQNAWIQLNQNYDPGTGWRFIPDKKLKLVVAPDLIPQARKIKGQIGSWMRAGNLGDTGSSPTAGQYRQETAGPAIQYLDFDFDIVDMTYLGSDRLASSCVHNTTNGTTGTAPTAAQSKTAWLLMSPKMVQYQVLRPIATNTYPLTGDEMARRIVFRGDCMVMSRFVMVDPRHSCLVLPW